MHLKFEKILHDYKREAYKIDHDKKSVEELTRECTAIADDVLTQKYNYHFHRLPDANRAEIINMINNYTVEAILPPVVEKLLQRQHVLEKRTDALVHLLEHLFEVISEDDAVKTGGGS